jgi:hypothetical protein
MRNEPNGAHGTTRRKNSQMHSPGQRQMSASSGQRFYASRSSLQGLVHRDLAVTKQCPSSNRRLACQRLQATWRNKLLPGQFSLKVLNEVVRKGLRWCQPDFGFDSEHIASEQHLGVARNSRGLERLNQRQELGRHLLA